MRNVSKNKEINSPNQVKKQNKKKKENSVTLNQTKLQDKEEVTNQEKEGIINVSMLDTWKETVERGFMIKKVMDLNEDSLYEIFNNLGYQFIELTKMDQCYFLLTFLEKEDIENIE